ncbi:hypothetical protein Salat_1000200 [Sesamum alatum]|uniref:Uncharacterized protein n=1 Tax=Sesamum alatum TaxID=300844 RepID=A0AAE2CRZ5_9LAMI|nr:hypothetical protein Salat_1000200 [Sesamum alatum]
MSNRSSSTATPNFDNLLLQSLMSRLQLRPPNLNAPPPFSAAEVLDDLRFFDMLLHPSESDSDSEKDSSSSSSQTQLAKEESKLENEIVRIILSGDTEKLKPNSGQAVNIGEHHICVGFHEETGSDYRVWEWHGHVMLFDEETGYAMEYIYGNYFERVALVKREMKKKEDGGGDEKAIKEENVGLKELFECGETSSRQIIHRSLLSNSGSQKFV